MRPHHRKAALFALIPLVIAVLVMTPRLASPQFGVMDDGLIYTEVQKILQGDFGMSYDLQAGRFRPLYWLYSPSFICWPAPTRSGFSSYTCSCCWCC